MVTSASEQDRIIKEQIYPLSEGKKKKLKRQTKHFGTSLVVQRLQIYAPNAGSQIRSWSENLVLCVATKTWLNQINTLTFNKNWVSFSDVQGSLRGNKWASPTIVPDYSERGFLGLFTGRVGVTQSWLGGVSVQWKELEDLRG